MMRSIGLLGALAVPRSSFVEHEPVSSHSPSGKPSQAMRTSGGEPGGGGIPMGGLAVRCPKDCFFQSRSFQGFVFRAFGKSADCVFRR